MRIAIIGGGLGGLAAALYLHRAGVEVSVHEQAGELREVGAGIVVAPNMARLVRELGLLPEMARFAVALEAAWEFRRWADGRVLSVQPMGEVCERLYGVNCYVAHRAELLAMFERALAPGVLRLGRRCVGVEQDDASVRLSFVAGGSSTTESYDAAIGADGIHSVIRPAVVQEDPARFSGLCAFRCLVPADRAPEFARRAVQTLWLGPGRHFVHYPISAGRLVNVVAMVPAGDWRLESWTADGAIDDLAAEFREWDPRLARLIEPATETKRWALYDRTPLATWTRGRVSLLGDAAHAMLPFFGQGACQAAEDAAVLATCLAQATAATVPAALARYEALRRPRAAQVQLMSRGREVANHLPDGPEQQARDARLAAGEPLRQSEWIYGYDALSAA